MSTNTPASAASSVNGGNGHATNTSNEIRHGGGGGDEGYLPANNANTSSGSHFYRTLPQIYQAPSPQQQHQFGAYQPHTTAGNEIPSAPYTFPPSAANLLNSMHSASNSPSQPRVPSGGSMSTSHHPSSHYHHPYSVHSSGGHAGYQQPPQQHYYSGYASDGQTRHPGYAGMESTDGRTMGRAPGAEYVAAYELAMANAVAGNIRGSHHAPDATTPYSGLSVDHLNGPSRHTSPRRFSLDHRAAHQSTPEVSPDHSASSTPVHRNASHSGGHGSHAGSTRKTKYTRSRTGCLGCRVKRVKCDEGRPACKRCVNAKRECVYPSIHELPKATIRALAAKKRNDSGDSHSPDDFVNERKRLKSNNLETETSVDHYMRQLDHAGNIERGDANRSTGPVHPPPNGNMAWNYVGQQDYAQQSPGVSNMPTSSAHDTYAHPQSGYSNSISYYHLNAPPVASSTAYHHPVAGGGMSRSAAYPQHYQQQQHHDIDSHHHQHHQQQQQQQQRSHPSHGDTQLVNNRYSYGYSNETVPSHSSAVDARNHSTSTAASNASHTTPSLSVADPVKSAAAVHSPPRPPPHSEGDEHGHDLKPPMHQHESGGATALSVAAGAQ